LFGRISKASLQWIVVVAIFLLAPVLQHQFGYTAYPSEFNFDGSYYRVVENQTSVLNHLFIDGWFPVFPWLGFALFGVMLGSYRWTGGGIRRFCRGRAVLMALACLAAGILLKIVFPTDLHIRGGFGEVFYPPTVGFCTYTLGIILALFAALDMVVSWRVFEPLATIGRSSLFLYVLQWFAIQYLLSVNCEGLDGVRFAFLWLCFAVFITSVAYGLRVLKLRWEQRPWFFRFLLGG
jgi:hypothetical protein